MSRSRRRRSSSPAATSLARDSRSSRVAARLGLESGALEREQGGGAGRSKKLGSSSSALSWMIAAGGIPPRMMGVSFCFPPGGGAVTSLRRLRSSARSSRLIARRRPGSTERAQALPPPRRGADGVPGARPFFSGRGRRRAPPAPMRQKSEGQQGACDDGHPTNGGVCRHRPAGVRQIDRPRRRRMQSGMRLRRSSRRASRAADAVLQRRVEQRSAPPPQPRFRSRGC